MAHYKGIIYAHDNDGTKIALSVKAQLTTFMALFTLIFNIISRITTQVFASNSHQKVIMSIQLDHFSNFMNRIASFTPITTPSARVLILGSMPGAISLSSDQYYAHPRNAFWGIMAALLGFSRTTPYKERIDALKKADIALWDVMHSCVRPGSLDSNIETDSIEVHDFKSFFKQYPNIKRVCFNGATAEKSFKKLVLSTFTLATSNNELDLEYIRLPSTSPAHASLSFDEKLKIWRTALKINEH